MKINLDKRYVEGGASIVRRPGALLRPLRACTDRQLERRRTRLEAISLDVSFHKPRVIYSKAEPVDQRSGVVMMDWHILLESDRRDIIREQARRDEMSSHERLKLERDRAYWISEWRSGRKVHNVVDW